MRLPATTISMRSLPATPDAKPLNLTRGFAGQLQCQDIYFTPDGGLDRARRHRHAQRRRPHRCWTRKAQP